MFNILKKTNISDDVNTIIFDMVKEMSLEDKVKHYPYHLELFEDEKYVNEIEQCIYNVAIANQKGLDGIRYFCRLAEQKDR